jgi:hypothetical protein
MAMMILACKKGKTEKGTRTGFCEATERLPQNSKHVPSRSLDRSLIPRGASMCTQSAPFSGQRETTGGDHRDPEVDSAHVCVVRVGQC